MEENTSAKALAALIADCASEQVLDKAVFSKCRDKSVSRATLTLKRVKGEVILQLETLRTAEAADTEVNKKKPVQAVHENLSAADTPVRLSALVGDFDQVNLMTTLGSCELRRSKGGKETLSGATAIRKALDAAPAGGGSAPQKITIGGNDKVKRRILSGAEPFLIELGVSDPSGRVHDKKQAKYRQINRFLELIRDVEAHLPAEGILHIADLCCGKSYLSFAVYHYFTAIRGREVCMVGVDMKADVMEECAAIARKLGMGGLDFICGDVTLYEFPEGAKADMVISLHACDIATDIVLDKAMDWGAKVVLSTPCCHHELNRRLNSPALGFIAEHSMLRQKLCEAATDALRLKKLEANGYDVTALELIDPEETPKNIMLRGIRKYDPASARCKRAAEEYAVAYGFLTGEQGTASGGQEPF